MGVIRKNIQIFANGSLIMSETLSKQFYKREIYSKDHTTFLLCKKILTNTKNFTSFKAKYLKF